MKTVETPRVSAAITSSTLGVNVFTAPGKVMVGERPKPFGEPLGFDPMTSDEELFNKMTELYPHWVANQSWLMFGFPGA